LRQRRQRGFTGDAEEFASKFSPSDGVDQRRPTLPGNRRVRDCVGGGTVRIHDAFVVIRMHPGSVNQDALEPMALCIGSGPPLRERTAMFHVEHRVQLPHPGTRTLTFARES
jgi:hypothetical protein